MRGAGWKDFFFFSFRIISYQRRKNSPDDGFLYNTFPRNSVPAFWQLSEEHTHQCFTSKCKQTNSYATEDHHTHVLSDPHNIIRSAGATETFTSSDLISDHTAQSPPTARHSHDGIWLPCAGVRQPSWERITWAAARRLRRSNSSQGADLLLLLKLLQALLLNFCITRVIFL